MASGTSINKLNELATNPSVYNDNSTKGSALYYGEIENILTPEELKKLQKISKYKNYISTDSTTANNILKNTNKKRGICRAALKKLNSGASGSINFYLPFSENVLSGTSFMSGGIEIAENSELFNFDNTTASNLSEGCKSFYSHYCENLKKRLKLEVGDSYNSVLGIYNSECNCYADRLKDKKELEPNNPIYSQIPDSIINTIQPQCELDACRSNISNYANFEINSNAGCGNLTICSNKINFKNTDMDDSDLNILGNLSNNCGADSAFNVSYKEINPNNINSKLEDENEEEEDKTENNLDNTKEQKNNVNDNSGSSTSDKNNSQEKETSKVENNEDKDQLENKGNDNVSGENILDNTYPVNKSTSGTNENNTNDSILSNENNNANAMNNTPQGSIDTQTTPGITPTTTSGTANSGTTTTGTTGTSGTATGTTSTVENTKSSSNLKTYLIIGGIGLLVIIILFLIIFII